MTVDLAAVIDCLPHPTYVVDRATLRVSAANPAAAALLALPLATLVGSAAADLLPTPEDLAYWADAGSTALHSDTVLCRVDGSIVHVERAIAALPGGRSVVVSLLDRSAAQRADSAREQRLAELEATLEATADGILVTDLDGGVRAFNRRFAQIWKVPDSVLQQGDEAALHGWMRAASADPADYDRRLAALQQAPLLVSSERLPLAGSAGVIERVTRPLFSHGRAQGRVHSFRELADKDSDEPAFTDALTGLPNRRQLAERVAQAARRARHGSGFALLLADIDGIGAVVAEHGAAAGDAALLDVAGRIQRCLRGHDVLARIDGGRFALLVHGADAASAAAAARRVLTAAGECSFDGRSVSIDCDVGVALFPQHGRDADALLRHARNAARVVGQIRNAGQRSHAAAAARPQRPELDSAMRQALASDRFALHYQPQLRLLDNALVGAEALLRWRDPVLGDVSPGRFIPAAEDSGLIVALGDWALAQALRQAALWHAGARALPVAVNVSALQFEQPGFGDHVLALLADSRLPPGLLELELPQSILQHDADAALAQLQALAAAGVQLAIDDFGSGSGSLLQLKRLPTVKLKINRSIVRALPDDSGGRDGAIVAALLQTARALGMRSVAVGVETEAQRQFLRRNGCDAFQGFLHAPALDPAAFEARMPAQVLPQPASGPLMRLVR